jgi:hypothetical protein
MWIKYYQTDHNDVVSDPMYHEFEREQTDDYIRMVLDQQSGEDGGKSIWFVHVDHPSVEHIHQRLALIELQIAARLAEKERLRDLEQQILFNNMTPLEKVRDRLKYTPYYTCVTEQEDGLIFFRLDTDDTDLKEQWENFTDVCDDLQHHLGLELTSFEYDHDTIWGYVKAL